MDYAFKFRPSPTVVPYKKLIEVRALALPYVLQVYHSILDVLTCANSPVYIPATRRNIFDDIYLQRC